MYLSATQFWSLRSRTIAIPLSGAALVVGLALVPMTGLSAQAPTAPTSRGMQRPVSAADTATAGGGAYVQASSVLSAGEYLTVAGGCGDCHTSRMPGDSTADNRFAGNPVGYRGPWGTSYAANLRMVVQHMDEDRWVSMLKTHNGRPPMPWENLHHMNEKDLRAIYQYIRSLGPAGSQMPRAVPAGQEPTTPYVDFTPKQPSTP